MRTIISSGLAAALTLLIACSGSSNTTSTTASTGSKGGETRTGGGSDPASTNPGTGSSDTGVARYQEYSGGTLSYQAAGNKQTWDQVWTITTAACGKFAGKLTTPDQPGYTVTGTYDDAGKVLTFVTSPALPPLMDFATTPAEGSHCVYSSASSQGLVCPDDTAFVLTDPGVTLTLTNPSAWKNHGEYVSSVARNPSSTSEQVEAAVHSCIGMPITSGQEPSGGECSTKVTWYEGTLSYMIGGSQYEEWAITATSSGRFFGYLSASNPALPNGAIVGTYDPATRTVLSFVTTQPEQGCVFISTPPVALTCPSYPGYPAAASGRFLTTNTSFDQAGESGANFALDQGSSSCIDLPGPVCKFDHDDEE